MGRELVWAPVCGPELVQAGARVGRAVCVTPPWHRGGMGEVRGIVEAAGALRRSLVDLALEGFSGEEAATLFEELSSTEKACAAARLMMAARAVGLGAHKEAGVADPSHWVARTTGTTRRDAKDALELARRLETHQRTKEALFKGAVSVSQAKEITKVLDELPDTEEALVAVASRADLTTLRDEVRERQVSSVPPAALHRRQLAARRLRHWRDALGMVCFEGALPPHTGIPLLTRIEREAARRQRATRGTTTPERFEAHAADALVALLGDGPAEPTRGRRTELVIVCDLYAWRRGHAHDQEPCHLLGGGPIPVEKAKELSADAFIKAVLHDGTDIQRVHHLGRRCTAQLRTALDLGPVPAFSGRRCADCQRSYGLERDHVEPVAHTGVTSISNVEDRCYPCHAAKTERDRRAGLLAKNAKARGPSPPS